MKSNPFEGLDDHQPYAPQELLAEFLGDTRRAYAKVRKVGIQRPKASLTRPSMLPELVHGGVALDAWLLTLALEPVLAESDPIPLSVWAKLLEGEHPVSEAATSRAFATLDRLDLIQRTHKGPHLVVRPLKEDGSKDEYTRPGAPGAEAGPGFFTIPHEYWLSGYAAKLKVPGKIALLIGLAETTEASSWEVPITRAQEWYGISERTLQRGYQELSREKLTLVHTQRIRAKRSATLHTTLYHRALVGPFSTEARRNVQEKAAKDVRATKRTKPKKD